MRVLLEGQFAFDVIDLESDLAPYKLLILPDVIALDATYVAKIKAYVAGGGRVLMTGQSGLGPDGFLFDIGATWAGTSPMTQGDFLLPVADLRAEAVNDPLFMYLPSERITVTNGQSLGAVYDPYFDRTPAHFSGHVNAPSQPEPTPYAGGVTKGGYTYLAHPIFSCYHKAGAVAMLEIAEKVIRQALGQTPLIRTSLPRAGRVTLRHQPAENRDIVHLLYATPALRGNLRGANIQPIQDLITLNNISVDMVPLGAVAAVRLVPEGTAIAFTQTDQLHFTVPQLRGHQMIEIQYA